MLKSISLLESAPTKFSAVPVANVAPANIGRPVTEYAPRGLEILIDEPPL